MNAITLIWRQVLKELKLFQMKENKEDAVEKTDKEPQKTLKCHEDKYTVLLPDTAPPTGREKEAERKQPVRLTQEVRTFLQKQYDFRYNLLTEETEYRPANKRAVPFEPVNKRELNTFCMEAHDQGISCWDKDLSRYIYSTCIPEYHPFRLYMEELPGWDGTDRLEALAQRVSDNQLWIKSFHTWMLGLTAQWLGMTGIHANSVAPILVSSEQGRQKSTFCKALMPPALSRYYMDNLKLSAQGKPERLLAEMGLLNMDEFDKYGTQQMPLLKNLMQMANLNICKAYQKNFRNLPRIMHDQIYAQLKAELLSGIRYWFTKEEERELQRHNAAFYHPCPAEEIFHACFRIAKDDEEGSERLSASDIFRRLKMYNPAAMRGSNPATFAQVLLAAGVTRKHTKYGNVYLVKPMKAA